MNTNDLELERRCRANGQIFSATSEIELLRIIALKLSSMDFVLESIQRDLAEIKYKK